MSPRNWEEWLRDILEAIDEITAFTRGMDYKAFSSDAKTVKDVELDLIIIGEAASQIPQNIQEENPQIPWSLMRAMRNRLVHVYFSIDEKLLWDTVRKDLPALDAALKSLLRC